MAKLNQGITIDSFNTFVKKLNITSNDGGESQSLIDANPVAFKYTEHLFRDSIEAEIIFKDTGGKYNGKSFFFKRSKPSNNPCENESTQKSSDKKTSKRSRGMWGEVGREPEDDDCVIC